MIEIKYKELFNVEVLHTFYSSGRSTDFDLTPTNDCQLLLKQLGIRFFPTEFGGKLFVKVKTTGGKDIIKNPIAEGTVFTFMMKLKRPVFENFTLLSLQKPKRSHYYFNNLVNNISSETLPLLVTNTASKIASDTDLLEFVSGTLSFNHTNLSNSQQAELKFIDSGETFSQTLSSDNNIFNFSFDLNKTPGGRGKLFVEGSEKASFYVIKAKDNVDIFGIAEIAYKSSLPPAYQFQQADNAIETKSYRIAFNNRSTRWRYLVTRKFNSTITQVKAAKTNGSPISFTAVNSGKPDQFILVSNAPVSLKEEPVTGIKLSDQADKVIIANLPNPALHLVKVEEGNTFSDILITI